MSDIIPLSIDDCIELFKKFDDPVNWEWPDGMNREREERRFRTVLFDLQLELGGSLNYETGVHIQDASFHSQIAIEDTFLRFSNFGSMVAFDDDECIAPKQLLTIAKVLRRHDLILIPSRATGMAYTGKNPGVTGIQDWYTRYFSWG